MIHSGPQAVPIIGTQLIRLKRQSISTKSDNTSKTSTTSPKLLEVQANCWRVLTPPSRLVSPPQHSMQEPLPLVLTRESHQRGLHSAHCCLKLLMTSCLRFSSVVPSSSWPSKLVWPLPETPNISLLLGLKVLPSWLPSLWYPLSLPVQTTRKRDSSSSNKPLQRSAKLLPSLEMAKKRHSIRKTSRSETLSRSRMVWIFQSMVLYSKPPVSSLMSPLLQVSPIT